MSLAELILGPKERGGHTRTRRAKGTRKVPKGSKVTMLDFKKLAAAEAEAKSVLKLVRATRKKLAKAHGG